VMATAPLGGCKESVLSIRIIDTATARLNATVRLGKSRVQLTPINAAILLPTTIFHGCAKGLAGTANNNTDEAPIGAIYQASKSPSTHQLISEDSSSPSRAPSPQSRRSFKRSSLKFGLRLSSH